ncbi:uncharacterized protein LOC143462333 isoform X1 [Clavelina lepadiformis]|uniref:CDP-diacylglycerol--inositol 3-phosphatidyltransferase n=1 Tax=Clavelina lepadiformis TaxID=159417 RepID=A0ABP0GN46_CLALP
MMKSTSGQNVFFFIPNIIGYFRLILLIASWIFIEQPTEFLSFYITSILLDAVDGWTARKLNQVSDFGAWLDVVVDVIGRGIIWCNLGKYGYAVPAWEWIVFVANHAQADSGQWKHKFDQSPLMVKHVMEKGFKTMLGSFVIGSIHIFPVWLYIQIHMTDVVLQIPTLSHWISWGLLLGRLLGFVVEFWCVYIHVFFMISREKKT